MKPLRTLLLLGVVAACITGLAYAQTVELKPTPLNFNLGATAPQQMGLYISGLPAPGWAGSVSFYLTYDKTKITLENFALNSTALQNLLAGQQADGVVLAAGRFGGTGTIDAAQASITFDVKLANGTAAGTYPIQFKTSDANNNFVWDSTFTPIAGITWKNGAAEVSTGPPDPASITGWTFVERQKDPVAVRANFGAGNATKVEFQYRINGTWTNIAATGGTTVVIGTRKADLTWPTPFAGALQTVNLRARITDRTQDSGWNEAPNALVVDNQPPALQSARGSNNIVNLTFQANEVLDTVTSTDEANYLVEDMGVVATQTPVTINKAERVSDTEVKLTLGASLEESHQYRVTATNIADSLGNIMASGIKSFVLQAKPMVEGAAFIRNGTNRTVDVTFSKEMKSAAPLTTAGNWQVTEKIAGVSSAAAVTVPVAEVAVQTDKKVVRLTLSQDLKQNSQYEVTAPVGSQDVDGKALEAADSKATFQTPFWHAFAKGLRMLGIPLDVAGRAIAVLGAKAVADYDAAAGGYTVDRGATPADVTGVVNLVVGKGYFARYDNDKTVYFDGQILPGNVAVVVPQGWSIITDPFATALGAGVDININQVELGDVPIRFAWHYNGTDWELLLNKANPFNATNIMNAWKGYFILAGQAGTITVAPQAAAAAEVAPLNLGDKASVIRLVARAGDVADSANVCGVGASAVQVANPPLGVSPVDLYFVGQDATPMAVDVRSGAVAQKWEAVVTTSLPNTQVTVAAPDLSSVPADYAVVLTDKDTGKKTHLRTSSGYTFTSGADGAARHLVLEIVPRAQCTLLSGVGVQQSGPGGVVVTFQLNGPAAVTAEVRNIAGRLVRRLVTDRAETAGTHSVSWNLTNSTGSAVPRGTYLVVLEARTEDGQQTKAVRPFSVNR